MQSVTSNYDGSITSDPWELTQLDDVPRHEQKKFGLP